MKQLERWIDGAFRVGYKEAAAHAARARGLLPPPIKLGAKALIPTSEIDAIIAARISGASDLEVRVLVSALVKARKGETVPA